MGSETTIKGHLYEEWPGLVAVILRAEQVLVWWRLEQESSNLYRFLAWDGTDVWMIEDETLERIVTKVYDRLEDYDGR